MTEDPRTTIIDVLPDGSVRPPEPSGLGWPRWAVISLAASAVAVSLVLILWLAVTILPIVAAAVLIGLIIARFRGAAPFRTWTGWPAAARRPGTPQRFR